MLKIFPFFRSSLIVVFATFLLLPDLSHAFFSPDLEKLTAAEINEMLQSKRAKSKSDIKRLMEWGYVVKGGDASSGLKLVTFKEWRPELYRRKSFGITGNTFELSDFNSISTWDLETGELREILVCEDDKYSIVGSAPGSPTIVISKYKKKGEKDNHVYAELASYDRNTLKKKATFDTELYLWGKKDDFRKSTGAWGVTDYSTSPDGSLFMATTYWGAYDVLQTATGNLVAHSNKHYPSDEKSAPKNRFLSGGKIFFTTLGDNKRALYDARSGSQLTEVPLVLFYPDMSPDGKYFAIGDKLMTGDGKKKLFEKELPTHLFLPGSDILMAYVHTGVVYYSIDEDGLYQLSRQPYDQRAKHVREAEVSRNGDYLFLAFDDLDNFMGVSDGYKFGVVRLDKPSKDDVMIVTKAQRAIELYKAGLKKQGVDMMRDLIGTHSRALWLKDYDRKIYEAGMPLVLVAEMTTRLMGEKVEAQQMDEYEKRLRARFFASYMLYAAAARQPSAVLRGYNAMAEEAKAGTVFVSAFTAASLFLEQALALKLMGRDNEAYDFLLEKSSISDFAENCIRRTSRYPRIFRSFLKDKKKLAVILDVDPKNLVDPGKELGKQNYLTPDGKLLRGAPPKPATPGVPSGGESGKSAQKAKKKPSSVVLD